MQATATAANAAAAAPRHLKKAWLQRHTTGEDVESPSTSASNQNTAIGTLLEQQINTEKSISDNDEGRDDQPIIKTSSNNIDNSRPLGKYDRLKSS